MTAQAKIVCLFAVWSVSMCFVEALIDSSVNCALRREISPCTCKNKEMNPRKIMVECQGISSFQQVVGAISNKFDYEVIIELFVKQSMLDDLPDLSFKMLALHIHRLELPKNNLSILPQRVFYGLNFTEYFNLDDNALTEVPREVLNVMPSVKTLTIGNNQIQTIRSNDFKALRYLKTLVLKGNKISMLEIGCFPYQITYLQLGSNLIPSLNGTLRNLEGLDWLALSDNRLQSLDGELPQVSESSERKLTTFFAANNSFTEITPDLAKFRMLNVVNLSYNNITQLEGHFRQAKHLDHINLNHNNISILGTDEFSRLVVMETLELGWNRIKSLNGSISPLKKLESLNLCHNLLTTFSLAELEGPRKLSSVNLTNNNMETLIGVGQANVTVELLDLSFNSLVRLTGSLMGVKNLTTLNLSHNFIRFISADDLFSLDELKTLDLSYNMLTHIHETSKIYLQKLDYLNLSHNMIVSLEKDFYGLPRLCRADLSYNSIQFIHPHLANKTQCQLYGVNSTLHIYLHGNPVVCLDEMEVIINNLKSKSVEIYREPNLECKRLLNLTSETQSSPEGVSTSAIGVNEVAAVHQEPSLR